MAVVKLSPPSPTAPQCREKAQAFKMRLTLTQQLLSVVPVTSSITSGIQQRQQHCLGAFHWGLIFKRMINKAGIEVQSKRQKEREEEIKLPILPQS